jgi:type 1 fimbria pilin
VAADNQGSGKITFTGEVISAPCSITLVMKTRPLN